METVERDPVFDGLTTDDWSAVRRAAGSLVDGQPQSVPTSIGYVDLDRAEDGPPFIGAHGGSGYQRCYASAWGWGAR